MGTNIIRVRWLHLAALRQLAILLTVISSTAMADEVRVTMDQVIEKWKLRQEQVQDLHIEWSEVIAIPAKSRSSFNVEGTTSVPDRDLSIPVTVWLWLSEKRGGFEAECDSWDNAFEPFLRRSVEVAANGKSVTSFHDRNDASGYPKCTISGQRDLREVIDFSRMPFLMLWRSGLLGELDILDITSFEIVDSNAGNEKGILTISNRQRQAERMPDIDTGHEGGGGMGGFGGIGDGGGGMRDIDSGMEGSLGMPYFDAGMEGGGSTPYSYIDLAVGEDLIPVGIRSYVGGKLSSRCSMSYSNTRDHVRIPVGWHIEEYCVKNNYTPGIFVVRMVDAKVTICDLKPVISDDLFKVICPPGTRVLNRMTQEDYVLRADGSKRALTPKEWTTEIPVVLQNAPTNSLDWSVILRVIGISILCLAIFALIQRNRSVHK